MQWNHVQGYQSCPELSSVLSVMAMVIRLSIMPATRSRKVGDDDEDNNNDNSGQIYGPVSRRQG